MKNILIFEDDYDLALQWSEALTDAGHRVEHALNMEIAAALCKQHLFDLVILDMFIVGPDGEYSSQGGVSLLQYLRQPKLRDFPEHYRHVPKLAVTGSRIVNNFDMLRVAEDSGCNDTLRKPFSNDVLVDAVNQLLKQRDAQKALEKE